MDDRPPSRPVRPHTPGWPGKTPETEIDDLLRGSRCGGTGRLDVRVCRECRSEDVFREIERGTGSVYECAECGGTDIATGWRDCLGCPDCTGGEERGGEMDGYQHGDESSYDIRACEARVGTDATLRLTGTIVEAGESESGAWVLFVPEERWGFGRAAMRMDLDAFEPARPDPEPVPESGGAEKTTRIPDDVRCGPVNVHRNTYTEPLTVIYPDGKEVSIPAGATGSFEPVPESERETCGTCGHPDCEGTHMVPSYDGLVDASGRPDCSAPREGGDVPVCESDVLSRERVEDMAWTGDDIIKSHEILRAILDRLRRERDEARTMAIGRSLSEARNRALVEERDRFRRLCELEFPPSEGFTEAFDTLRDLGIIVQVPADDAHRAEWGSDEMWVFSWHPLARTALRGAPAEEENG